MRRILIVPSIFTTLLFSQFASAAALTAVCKSQDSHNPEVYKVIVDDNWQKASVYDLDGTLYPATSPIPCYAKTDNKSLRCEGNLLDMTNFGDVNFLKLEAVFTNETDGKSELELVFMFKDESPDKATYTCTTSE